MVLTVLKTNFNKSLFTLAAGIISLASFSQSGPGGGSGSGSNNASAPELVFQNPVLVSGIDNTQGATYRFSNVSNGVDAELKLKKFSRPDIVMQSVDLGGLGWEKALQPQFGLPGLVLPWQNWYIDFELSFFKAGTKNKQKMKKVDLTALDVDGDGNSVSEYVEMDNPSSVVYSTISYLAGNVSINSFDTDEDDNEYSTSFAPGTEIGGPVENFMNIDTNATQVMATYNYVNVDKIKFRYGGKSRGLSSNGSGIRLNSMWYREFSLAPSTALPTNLTKFSTLMKSKSVDLSWTAQEEHFNHYAVQRSVDGKEFVNVGIVFANNAAGSNNYQFRDADIATSTGLIYYRLQLVDNIKEGVKYSDVRVVRIERETRGLEITAFPNPVKNQLRVTLPTDFQGKEVAIEVFSTNGVKVQTLLAKTASQTESLNIQSAQRGMYIVKVSCGGKFAQQQIIKD